MQSGQRAPPALLGVYKYSPRPDLQRLDVLCYGIYEPRLLFCRLFPNSLDQLTFVSHLPIYLPVSRSSLQDLLSRRSPAAPTLSPPRSREPPPLTPLGFLSTPPGVVTSPPLGNRSRPGRATLPRSLPSPAQEFPLTSLTLNKYTYGFHPCCVSVYLLGFAILVWYNSKTITVYT